MKTQQAVTGRPMWQVSLVASTQRGEKRLNQGWVRVFKAVRPVLTALSTMLTYPGSAAVFTDIVPFAVLTLRHAAFLRRAANQK
jgi:hypothetical protein